MHKMAMRTVAIVSHQERVLQPCNKIQWTFRGEVEVVSSQRTIIHVQAHGFITIIRQLFWYALYGKYQVWINIV